jgi:hypothetical protein
MMNDVTNIAPKKSFVLGKTSSKPATPYLGSKFDNRHNMAVDISEKPK